MGGSKKHIFASVAVNRCWQVQFLFCYIFFLVNGFFPVIENAEASPFSLPSTARQFNNYCLLKALFLSTMPLHCNETVLLNNTFVVKQQHILVARLTKKGENTLK